jgi:hypothetical protein
MVEKNMVTLTERTIMKSRSGVYSDTAENRRKHRVGQKYGVEKQSDDGEKTEKKETDPAKELEAVNKVIAAINEGKMNLPAAEVIKLSEKKQKLEAAKKQAEKINAGVKANEEKKNAEEVKETSKKINEAQKKRVKQAKEEVQSLRTKVKDSDKYDEMTEKGTKANEDRQKRIADKKKDGFLPIGGGQVAKVDEVTKDGDLKITIYNGDDEWKDIAKKGSQVFEELKDSYNSKSEAEESYSRVKFDDVPNSGKINLKKYLSDKVRKGVDEKWSNIKNIPTENLKKMEKGLVNDLNKNFEAIKKSQRAELLYSIMKVKGELESRGKENKGEQSSPKLYSGGKISGTKNEYSKNLNDVLNSENADSIVIPEHKLQGWHDTEDALAGTNWKVSREVDKNGNYELGGKYYIFHKKK